MSQDLSQPALNHQRQGEVPIEAQYQALLDEYTTLESQAPLTTNDARRLGSFVFEQQMRQQMAAGAYSAQWMHDIEALSIQLSLTLERLALPYFERQRWLVLQNKIDQLNPAVVLGIETSQPVNSTTPDSVADELAQGATICQLF